MTKDEAVKVLKARLNEMKKFAHHHEGWKKEFDALSLAIHALEVKEELEKALILILPLARGYAYTNNVGANKRYIEHAEEVLAQAERGQGC